MLKIWKKKEPTRISNDDVEKKFCELKESWFDSPNLIKIKNDIIRLLGNDSINIDWLDIIPILVQMDRGKYRDFLNRMNQYLVDNGELSKESFYELFWNLKMAKSNSQNHSTWKYNKSDFHQWWTGECVLISSLEILKKTPFFETLIRCSLKRNNSDDWWILLVPLCNKNWQFKEIKDDEINYLQNPYFVNWRGVISESSLWFNILESIFIKEYLYNSCKLDFNTINELDYDTINKKVDWFFISWNLWNSFIDWGVLNYFLWKDIINFSKDQLSCCNFSKECLEYILELSKVWIIKLWFRVKIPGGFKYSGKPTKSVNSTRWYMVDIYGENDEFLYWVDERGRHCFSPKWCDEWFTTWHQYSIEKIFKKNGKTYVVVINPRFTEKKLSVSIEQFMKMVRNLDVICFNVDKMFVECDVNNK